MMTPRLNPNRRDFLYGLSASLGSVALTQMLQAGNAQVNSQDELLDGVLPNRGPLSPKQPMHTPKAKACIMLFMEGGPSQVDTFDPKPKLNELHKTESKRTAGLAGGFRFYVGSPFKFRKVGESGLEMSDQWPVSYTHLTLPTNREV